ncbi:MAG TPA: radical SAM protein [Pseudothermotoga sp.]|nr:radical SAM protein [Pseudothermotoga sp.]
MIKDEKFVYLPENLFAVIETSCGDRFLLDKVNFDFYKLDENIQIAKHDCSFLFWCESQNIMEEAKELKKSALFSLRKKMVKNNEILRLALNLSQICTLRCKYCYANVGTYGNPGFMSKDVLTRTLDFFLSNYKIHNVHVFGGEPLLNIEMIEKLFEILKQKHQELRITIATSLFVSEKIVEHLVKICKFYEKDFQTYVVISLDGPREIHNYTRPSSNNMGSFEQIIRNVESFRQNNIPISFEVTYTGLHKKFGLDVLKIYRYFYEKFNTMNITIAPVYDWSNSLDRELKTNVSMASEYYKALVLLLKRIRSSEKLNDFEKIFLDSLLRNYINPSNLSGNLVISTFCPAGSNSFIVDILGNIYPCQLVVGDSKYKISNVVEHNEERILKDIKNWRSSALKQFVRAKHKKCRDCYFTYYCNRCVFKREYEKDMFKTCDVERKILETIIEVDPWSLSSTLEK